MDVVAEFLGVLLVGLSTILAVIAGGSAAKYGDARLAFVAGALAVLATVGVLAVLNQVSPAYGSAFDIDTIPLALLVVAVALLYASIVGRRSRKAPSRHE